MDSVAILLLYPIVMFFCRDPAALKWSKALVEGTPLPPSAYEDVERRGRWFYLVGFGVAGILLAIWADWRRVSAEKLGLWIDAWNVPKLLVFTAIASTVFVSFAVAYHKLSPNLSGSAFRGDFGVGPIQKYQILSQTEKDALLAHPLSRGPVLVWLLVFIVGGFAEESWRALSLIAMQEGGLNAALAVLISSMAFTMARMSGLPSRIRGTRTEVCREIVLGALLAAVFLASKSVWVSYVAGLAFNVANLLSFRHFPVPRPSSSP